MLIGLCINDFIGMPVIDMIIERYDKGKII